MMGKLLQGSSCLIISWMGLALLNITKVYVLIFTYIRSPVLLHGFFHIFILHVNNDGVYGYCAFSCCRAGVLR